MYILSLLIIIRVCLIFVQKMSRIFVSVCSHMSRILVSVCSHMSRIFVSVCSHMSRIFVSVCSHMSRNFVSVCSHMFCEQETQRVSKSRPKAELKRVLINTQMYGNIFCTFLCGGKFLHIVCLNLKTHINFCGKYFPAFEMLDYLHIEAIFLIIEAKF